MDIQPTGRGLGATVTGCDLRQPLDDAAIGEITRALGRHGVLCFPGQQLAPAEQKAFCGRFGPLEVHVSGVGQVPDHPEVMILSNIVDDGRPLGLADAGQGWHTDMSFSEPIGLATFLHGIVIPQDGDGRPLGATRFADMHAAWDDLPDELKTRLADARAVHDFAKFWDMMRRRPGSRRAPLTEEQRRRKPPVAWPVAPAHPVTGRRVLYADPGYTTHIEGMPADESAELLSFLFAHQVQPKYVHVHRWTEGDLLMWDNIGTIHDAVADYGDQPRLMRRCQAVARGDVFA
jgi:taurine dioxygenase